MKIRSMLPVLGLLFTLQAFGEDVLPATITDVAVMHGRDDGRYDVFCVNGNREVVTDLDIRLNNVCPNLKESKPTGILSLQKRSDGDYDVVCRNLRKLVATEEEILEGTVCAPATPKYYLETGVYKAVEGYMSYYDQDASSQLEGDRLISVSLKARSSGWTCVLDCQENRCRGRSSMNAECGRSVLEVLEPTKYKFNTGAGLATFKKQ